MLQNAIVKSAADPKNLFIVDGLGALLSSFLLGVALVKFQEYFGIPVPTLYFLAVLPLFFVLYDFYSYIKPATHSGRLLRILSYVNVSYCVLSLGLAFYHFKVVTLLGWVYILVEIAIVLFIAIIEFKVSKRLIL